MLQSACKAESVGALIARPGSSLQLLLACKRRVIFYREACKARNPQSFAIVQALPAFYERNVNETLRHETSTNERNEVRSP